MTIQVSAKFEQVVRDYINIDNKLKSAREAIKILNDEKNKCCKIIKEYIKNNSLQNRPIHITGGQLKFATTKKQTPVNKNFIFERLTLYFKSEEKAQEIIEFIYAGRETTESETIRRTTNRKSKE